MGGLRARLRLARWLGPWMDQSRSPRVIRERRDFGETYAQVYHPARRAPRGAMLLISGFHYEGPDDPRMIRFASVLAHAGLLVYAPSLRSFRRLRLERDVMSDAFDAFEALRADPRRPAMKPGILSVSFGCLPALRTAARFGDEVGGVLTFGGFADWAETAHFSLFGAPGRPHDPLNRPALFLNLLGHLPTPTDRPALEAAWRRFIEATWGRPEMQEKARFEAIAEGLLDGVAAQDRELFLQGCDLRVGGEALAQAAIERGEWAWLDGRADVARIHGPLVFVHGAEDDVIPVEQAEVLRSACGPQQDARTLITGLYGHSNHMDDNGPKGGRWAELRTMWAIVDGVMGITERPAR